ncbi:hypothetical protein IJ135_00325 [Candidatus Saccharibacteria bacterium]|nr:hypothetical protein [Candidatus Saccharibacteria bacterium]
MKYFTTDLKIIYENERLLLGLMVLDLLASIALLVFGLIVLNPDVPVVKVGYGDIGGYRDGSWTDMLAFPILAVIFGVLHNFITMKIFHKRGAGMAKFFCIVTTALIFGAFVVLIRLTKEG